MSGLLATLGAGAQSLDAFERSTSALQNNVNNSSTVGYARQEVHLAALPFNATTQRYGGVEAGELRSTRNRFLEDSVRSQEQQAGSATARMQTLSLIESLFPVDANQGLPQALNQLWSAFSSWSASPNDANARQQVIISAVGLSDAFRSLSTRLSEAARSIDGQVEADVDKVNRLGAQIADLNSQQLKGPKADPSRDAALHATLEELSQVARFDVLNQADGTVTVLLEGQTPLVLGDRALPLKVEDSPSGPQIINASGDNVTVSVRGGELGGLLSVRYGELAQLIGTATEPGQLDTLASSLASRINTLLTSGVVDEGPPPVAGRPLFESPSGSVHYASDIKVATGTTAQDLAAVDPGPPASTNGIALRLAGLADSTDAADQIDGLTYGAYYSSLAANVGGSVQAADRERTASEDAATLAKNLREQVSGVSLDEQAAELLQLQKSYQASARFIQIINELADTLVNLGT